MKIPKCICFCFAWLVLGGAVSTSPQITSPPQSVVVAAGGTATLLCSMTGSPQPTALWKKAGGTLPAGRYSNATSNGTLRITGLVQADTGQYYCVASNAAGSVASLNSSITVAYINSVSNPTQVSLSPKLNDYLVLPCPIPSSVPSPTVTWSPVTLSSRVGVTLSGSLVYSYLMSGDTSSTLTCTVSNGVVGTSQVTTQVTLTYQSPTSNVYSALFVFTPLNQTALVGAMVMFDCFAVGTPVPTISWFKDGVAISPSSRVTFAQTDKILAISNVTMGDGGAYSCKATQTGGYSITSAAAQLTILVPPTIVQSFIKTDQYASLPSNLTCTATGTAPLVWAWLLNGVPWSTRAGCNTTAPVPKSSGWCRCSQRSFHGKQPSAGHFSATTHSVFSVRQLLHPAPMPGNWLPSPYLPVDQGIESSLPANPARYNVSTDTNTGSLTISSTLELDSAFYTCTATNVAGSVTTQPSFLRVIAYPTVFNITQTPATPPNAGTSLTLWCSMQPYLQLTNPSYAITWTKDGAPFYQTLGRVGSYLFSSLTVANNGFYECFATILDSTGLSLVSKLGSMTLTVGAPLTAPSEPLNPLPSLINSTSFYLQWSAPLTSGGIAIRNYTVQLSDLGNALGCVPPQQGWVPVVQGVVGLSAWVMNLRPFSAYLAAVVAYNSIKSSNLSLETSVITTLSSAPSAPPVSVSAVASSKRVTLSWQPPPPCSINDVPQGYSIRLLGVTSQMYQTTGTTTITISGLQPNQTYSVQVAIYTNSGTGPYSSLLSVSTPEVLIPTPPTSLVGTVSSSTSVTLTWSAPTEGRPPTSYTVLYYQIDSPVIQNTVTIPASQRYSTVTGLMGGSTYNVSVFATNSFGSGDPSFIQVQLIQVSPSDTIFQAPWFLPAVAGGGGGVLALIIVVVSCCCCCYCCSHRKMKVTLNENAAVSSSGSPAMSATSGFSEFQRASSKKKLKPTVLNGIMHIHASPTPSRRSTDYADPHYIRTQSTITTSSVQYGGSPNASMSTLPPPPQYDGSLYDQRRHAISPPCVEPPYMFREPVSASQLTQDLGRVVGARLESEPPGAASANSSADEKQPYPQAAAGNGVQSAVASGWGNSNAHAHLPTLQENSSLQPNAPLTADARNTSQGDSRARLLSQQTRSNAKTHGLVEHSQRLQPPQPMPSLRAVADIKTVQGVVLPPPPPMDDMYPSGSESSEQVAKGPQSKSSTLSSNSSSPRKAALDLGQLTKLSAAAGRAETTAVNPRLWQPQLLTQRNLEYSMKGYASTNSSDADDAGSIVSTYV
ncbi:hypothetical protein EMCRGX_G000618 [Ephydatia muelleri]